MNAFELCLPTRIIFGEGELSRVGQQAAQFGRKALLISYEEQVVRQLGFLEQIERSCAEAGLELLTYFGVSPNPTIEHARDGIALVKEQKPDVLIALGGGSVIDEAKCIGIGALYEGDVWDIYSGAASASASLPVVAVVTIPATSSEMNNTSVMTNQALHRKEGHVNPLMYPRVAILDPTLTYGIPIRQTAYSVADIISHLLEGYLSHDDPWAPMQERYCEGMILTAMECMEKMLVDPRDPQARATLMWVATYSWNGFYVCGLGPTDLAIHVLGHSLSAFYNTPHGAAMSVIIPGLLDYILPKRAERIAKLGRAVFGITESEPVAAATATKDALTAWFTKIGAPVNFREAGIPTDQLDRLVDDALVTANMWGLSHLHTKESCMDILKRCL